MNQDSRRSPLRRSLKLALGVTAASLAFATSASAADPTAELRVEGPDGKIDPGTWYVLPKGKIAAPLAKPAGNCDTRSKPARDSYPQRSALGVALNGAAVNPDLKGTRVQPYDFGPLLCRFAGIVGEPFDPVTGEYSGWNYYVNLNGGSSSADLARVGDGDRVLWAFSNQDTFNTLEITDTSQDLPGTFVRVVSYGFDGQPTGVEDANIVGADTQESFGSGLYRVTFEGDEADLYATRGDDVPSNLKTFCKNNNPDCPAGIGRTIVGTSAGDSIATTRGDDVVRAGGGNDAVRAIAGGTDRINCGAGRADTVIAPRGDSVKTVNCERIRRPQN